MIISDKSHIAMKEHKCYGCSGKIGKGEKYHRRFGGYDKLELHERILCSKCYEKMTDVETAYLLDIYEIEAENEFWQSDSWSH